MRAVGRTVVALCIFLLASGSSIGFFGAVEADQEAGFPGTPIQLDSFELPERRVGDRWGYRIIEGQTTSGERLEMEDEPTGENLSWQEPSVAFDEEGQAHQVNIVAHTYRGNQAFSLYLDRETDDVVSMAFVADRSTAGRTVLVEPLRSSIDANVGFEMPRMKGSGLTDCMAGGLWPGPVRVAEGLRLRPCVSFYGVIDRPTDFVFQGAYRVDGHDYAVFGRADEPDILQTIERIVFRTDIPYPVEMTFLIHDEDDLKDGARLVQRMVHFEPGDRVLPAGPYQPLGRLPRPTAAPLAPHGLDDQGLDHPYPLREAYQESRDDPSESRLRDFLAEHPDAVVHSPGLTTTEGDGGTQYRWAFTVTDGREQVYVCRTRVVEEHRNGSPNAVQLALSVAEDRFDRQTCPADPSGDAPHVTQVDAGFTAGSLQDAWEAYARLMGLPSGPITYGLEYPSCPDCGEAPTTYVGIWQGSMSETGLALSPVQETEIRVQYHRLEFGADGTIDKIWHMDATETVDAGPVDAANTPMTLAAPETFDTTWRFPSVASALIASLVAALLAILYWLFPYLKQGTMTGLFSRVSRDQALDHPARSGLMAAVEAEPGVHDRELQRRTGLARGAMRHHLDKLVDTGLVHRRRSGGYTGYWPAEAAAAEAVGQAAALRSETARQIQALLEDDPGLTQKVLAQRLGVSRQAVGKHLKRLRAAGLAPS